MGFLELTREGDVFVMTMIADDNRFNNETVAEINAALDEVEASTGPAALVTTGTGKFYSNGLDLDGLRALPDGGFGRFLAGFYKTIGRVLASGVPSVAAINGHCFAGGAFFALCHDYRIMREDRGYFCVPEIELGLPLWTEFMGVLRTKLSPVALRDLVLTGVRLGGPDALGYGAVDAVAPDDRVLEVAVAKAASLASKPREIYAQLKSQMYPELLGLLVPGFTPIGSPHGSAERPGPA
jgi:Delta3-Delta2-enoyl-CoA isomerase